MISTMQARSTISVPCCREQITGRTDRVNTPTSQYILLYNCSMKLNRGLAWLFASVLFACQPSTPSAVTILDNSTAIIIPTEERVPSKLLAEAGITLNAND